MFGRRQGRRTRRRVPAETEKPVVAYRSSRHESERPADNTGRSRSGQSEARSLPASWALIGRRAAVLAMMTAAIIAVIAALTVSPHAKVTPLTTNNTSKAFLRNQVEYQSAANKLLAGSIWNRNKITINTAGISRQMLAQFPELASVSVTLPMFGHQPTVYVQPARAALVVAADNGAFVVDTSGKALMSSANLPTARNLPQVVDQSGLPVRLGRQVLTVDDINFIQTVLGQLSARHAGVTSMVLPASSRELDIYITGQPYFVKFNLEDSGGARQQAGTYLATAAELQRQHVTPAHYIDVRVSGRAYYQ